MSDLSIGYRGMDMPIAIGSTFLKRVQDVEFSRTIPTRAVDELGTNQHVALIQETYQYQCRLTRIGIEDGIEGSIAGKGSPILLTDYIAATGVTVMGPNGGIEEAKLVSVEYEATAGFEPPREIFTLEGTAWTSGSIASVLDLTPVPTGADVSINIGGALSRAQRVRVRADLRKEAAEEIGTADPIGYAYDPPDVNAEIEFLHSTVTSDVWDPDQDDPPSLVLTINDKVLTVEKAVSEGQVGRGNVRGWATSVYRYVSLSGKLTTAWT